VPIVGKALRVGRVRSARDEGSQGREGYPAGEKPAGSGKRRESLKGPKAQESKGPDRI